jgi:cell division protein ZapA
MAMVTLTINGRLYEIACEENQVDRVQELGRDIDLRAQTLLAQVGVVSDSRLLVMLCLLLSDELAETRSRAIGTDGALASTLAEDERLAGLIEQLAGRIEVIATRLERA